jgi:hypothetical protein
VVFFIISSLSYVNTSFLFFTILIYSHVQCMNTEQTRNHEKTTACLLIKLVVVPDDGA